MIPKDKLKEMKKTLGHGYPVDLAERLLTKKVVNTKGLTITDDYIRQIFLGRIINIDIINIIIDDYNVQKEKLTKMYNKIQKL